MPGILRDDWEKDQNLSFEEHCLLRYHSCITIKLQTPLGLVFLPAPCLAGCMGWIFIKSFDLGDVSPKRERKTSPPTPSANCPPPLPCCLWWLTRLVSMCLAPPVPHLECPSALHPKECLLIFQSSTRLPWQPPWPPVGFHSDSKSLDEARMACCN